MSSEFQIETLKIMVFDPKPTAEIIEMMAKPYLIESKVKNQVGINIIKDFVDRILITGTEWSKKSTPTLQ